MDKTDLFYLARSIIRIYAKSMRTAFLDAYKMWWIPLLAAFIYPFILSYSGLLPAKLGFIGGLIHSLVHILLISHYLGLLRFAVLREKIGWRLSLDMAWVLFPNVLVVYFLFFILQLLLASHVIALIILAIIFISSNQLTEIIYLGQVERNALLTRAWNFLKDNYLEWLLFLLMLSIPVLYLAPQTVLYIYASSPPVNSPHVLNNLLSVLINPLGIINEISKLLIEIFVFYFMLMRAHLFLALDASTRRKRIFAEKVE